MADSADKRTSGTGVAQQPAGSSNGHAGDAGSDKDGASAGGGITRVSKACEPCRIRKTRCDIATQAVCSECLKRGQAETCTIREKARPNRPVSALPKKGEKGEKRARSSSIHAEVSAESHEPVSMGESSRGPSVSFDTRPPVIRRLTRASPAPVETEHQREPPRGAISMVESVLEQQAKRLFDIEIHVALRPENVFDAHPSHLDLSEMGLAPGDPSAVQQAHHWINTHFRAIHHNTPFLYLPQVLAIATKVFGSPQITRRADSLYAFGHPPTFDEHGHARPGADAEGVGADDLALLYAILALGSLREQTYDSSTKRYRTFDDDNGESMVSPASHRSVPSYKSRRAGQSLFKMAKDELELLESPSETAVQALFLMHMFVSNTSMSRRSRDYVARAVMMAHEIGLNRRLPQGLGRTKGKGGFEQRDDRHAARRRAILYLYVYFSDVYLSALESHPPLIKRQDYDRDVFDPIDQTVSSGIDTPSGTPLPGLRAFVDLVTTIGSVLEQLHQGYYGASATWSRGPEGLQGTAAEDAICGLVLRLEAEMDRLRERLGEQTFLINLDEHENGQEPVDALKRTAVAGSLLRQMHYNWSRIALRAPFLKEPLLRHSSLSICASSAKAILHFHRHVINAGLLNLPWMQLRRVSVSVYIIFLALWAGEMPHAAAAISVNNTLDVLQVIGTRWKSAGIVAGTVQQLAEKSGLAIGERRPPPKDRTHEIDMFTQQLGSGTTQNDLASIGMGMPGMMDWSFGTGGNTVNPVQALGNPVGGIQNQGDGVPLPGMPQSANLPDGTGDLGDIFDLDRLQQFQADLVAMGGDNDFLTSWQALQQPPW